MSVDNWTQRIDSSDSTNEFDNVDKPTANSISTLSIGEKCMCSAEINLTGPSSLVLEIFKQINTWRRFHVCTYRTDETQPVSGAYRDR